MKNKTRNKPLTLDEKLKKYAVPFEDMLAELSPKERKEIDSLSNYYIALMDIFSLRKNLNLTQAELAKRSSVPRSTISKIESGERNATIHTLMKIAAGMGKELRVTLV